MDQVDDSFVTTDEVAISLTRDSLKELGLDVSNFEPVPYDNNQDAIFARNAINKNDGYVLWHEKGKSTKFEYSVSVKRKDRKIYCDAGRVL